MRLSLSLSPFSPSGKPDHHSRSSSPARTICFIAEPRRWLAPPQPFPPSLPVLSSQPKFQKLEIIYGAGSLYRQTSLQVETRIFRQNRHDLALKKTQDFSPKLSSPFLLHRQKSSRVKIITGNLSSNLVHSD